MSDRPYLSIGEVLGLLLEEFPDVTISKIRFLESQGLIDPERTPSGYRKFYDPDVERLRVILREQRENFLPLKVIRDRLESGAIEGEGRHAAAGHPQRHRVARRRRRQPGDGGLPPAPVGPAAPGGDTAVRAGAHGPGQRRVHPRRRADAVRGGRHHSRRRCDRPTQRPTRPTTSPPRSCSPGRRSTRTRRTRPPSCARSPASPTRSSPRSSRSVWSAGAAPVPTRSTPAATSPSRSPPPASCSAVSKAATCAPGARRPIARPRCSSS